MLHDIPDGDYNSLTFTLGVDSVRNCSGFQSGSLDPVYGMFWAWNTGYIFLKLEGKSPESKSPSHLFEYHIGGYKKPANCIRMIHLSLKNSDGHFLKIEIGKKASLKIKTDVAEIFKNPSMIDFSKLSSVTDFHNSEMMADNYSDMFSLISGYSLNMK